MDLVLLIAIVFGLVIFVVLVSLFHLDDHRAKIRLRFHFFGSEAKPDNPWKTRYLTFLDAIPIPDLFTQLVDEQVILWSGIQMTYQQLIASWWLLSLLGVISGVISIGIAAEFLIVDLIGFALVLLLTIGPYLYLKFRIRERERLVERSLPGFLDMLTFTIEAGLGLVPALKRVCKGDKSILGEELRRSLIQVELGFSQREVLKELVTRLSSSDVKSFVEAILLSERLGTSLARTMRVQANLLRTRRRQRAEVKAQTAPIRIIPALVFFFLPGLLLIYLAPPIINFLMRR